MEVNGKAGSRIPRLLRSASFQGRTTKKETIHEDENETDDVGSLSSVCSAVSCATQGIAYRRAVNSASSCVFHDYRKPSKYAIHCCSPSSNSGSQEYLTPTQRANRTIRHLKELLKKSESDCSYKDFEIQRLTRELVAVRMEHAQCEFRNSSAAEAPENVSSVATSSLGDSGLFDDLNHASQSKESLLEKHENVEKRRLVSQVDQIEDLKRHHANEIQNLRSRFTDRLETALSQLGDSNTRYANLQSSYDLSREELRRTEAELKRSHEEISELERKIAKLQSDMETREVQDYQNREGELIQIDALSKTLADKDLLIAELQSKMDKLTTLNYLPPLSTAMAGEGDLENAEVKSVAATIMQQRQSPAWSFSGPDDTGKYEEISKNSYPTDPAITLRFLRSAIFYLLTDGENWNGHVAAVQSILEFSPEERSAVERAVGSRYGFI